MGVRRQTGLRFDVDVYERARAAAMARNVDINWLIERLVEEGLERLTPGPLRLTALTTAAERNARAEQIEAEVYENHHGRTA